MQVFERRRIIVKTMEEGDVEPYYNQFSISEKEREEKIEATKEFAEKCKDSSPKNMLIFAVKEAGSSSNKVIGTILTRYIGRGSISLKVSVPREENEWSYGVEIIDQFAKICKEEKFFEGIKSIKLDSDSLIAQKYIESKDMKSSYINVA